MSTRRCKIHYRRLRRDNGQFPEATLSQKISDALKVSKTGALIGGNVALRVADVPRVEGYKRLFNDFFDRDGFVFGDICLFSPGQMQSLLKLTVGGGQPTLAEVMSALEIAERKAPDGHEYLHGIAYWLAIGDHFYQIQHTSLQSKAMEEYLTWLLRDQASVIASGQYVELVSEFDRAQVGDDLGGISSIEVGGFVPETIFEAPTTPADSPKMTEVETTETIAPKVMARWDKAKAIIETLFGSVEAAKMIESIPSQAALEVTVNIGYRSTKRKISKEFMGNIAAGLRNAPDGELRIRGKNGLILGEDARLSMDMGINKMSETSGLLDLEHALKQMLEVHRRFLHDGKITG
ncbi:hypothetical protein ABIE69_003145 [Rhodobacteraceae bacterium MBR-64]|jgi:hypothetical protein